jgi:hypothetical protein
VISDSRFTVEVDKWIERAVAARPLDFCDLLRVLPGVDPGFVRSRVESSPRLLELVRWPHLPEVAEGSDPRLPVPHPLDFDWRFQPATIEDLANSLAQQDFRITLIGTPALWLSLLDRGRRDRVMLLDANPLLEKTAIDHGARSTVRLVDVLSDKIPKRISDVVVADPPWYPEAIAGFIWVGSSLLRHGGQLWLSAPPVGTRPGIKIERKRLLEFARKAGLTLSAENNGGLTYSTPPFERAALRAAGLARYVPRDWRRGDLLVFQRTSGILTPRPIVRERRWSERVIKGVRIRIDDAGEAKSRDPRLISLLECDVLPSVSRRDERRCLVRVWTSGNRIFGCEAPVRLLEIIDTIISGRSSKTREGREVAEGLQMLVERERSEYMSSYGSAELVRSAPAAD